MLYFVFLEKSMGIFSSLHFVCDFSRKSFSCYILLTETISFSDCLCLFRYWAMCVLQLFVSQFLHDQKVKTILRKKNIFRWNKKHFSSLLRLKYIVILIMIILKLADAFEIHVHFKMIILKGEQVFLNLKGWNYNWVFKEITKSFTFKYFQKTEVYLVPIQISKMEVFVKIVNSLMPLTIFNKELHLRCLTGF